MARVGDPVGVVLFRRGPDDPPVRIEARVLPELELALNPLVNDGAWELRDLRDMAYEISMRRATHPWRVLSIDEAAWLEKWQAEREAASQKEKRTISLSQR